MNEVEALSSLAPAGCASNACDLSLPFRWGTSICKQDIWHEKLWQNPSCNQMVFSQTIFIRTCPSASQINMFFLQHHKSLRRVHHISLCTKHKENVQDLEDAGPIEKGGKQIANFLIMNCVSAELEMARKMSKWPKKANFGFDVSIRVLQGYKTRQYPDVVRVL